MNRIRFILNILTFFIVTAAPLEAMIISPKPDYENLYFTLECNDGTLIEDVSFKILEQGGSFRALFDDLDGPDKTPQTIPVYGNTATIINIVNHVRNCVIWAQSGMNEYQIFNRLYKNIRHETKHKEMLAIAHVLDFSLLIQALQQCMRENEIGGSQGRRHKEARSANLDNFLEHLIYLDYSLSHFPSL